MFHFIFFFFFTKKCMCSSSFFTSLMNGIINFVSFLVIIKFTYTHLSILIFKCFFFTHRLLWWKFQFFPILSLNQGFPSSFACGHPCLMSLPERQTFPKASTLENLFKWLGATQNTNETHSFNFLCGMIQFLFKGGHLERLQTKADISRRKQTLFFS